jgi:hypothetical protein
VNDVAASEFGGFHRIEKALWEEDTAKGMAPVAEQLLADVEELEQKVKNVELQGVQIANGANELLGEVSASKITGEEERYSHIDLSIPRPTSKAPRRPSKRSSRCSVRRIRSWRRKSKRALKTSTPC